MATRWERAELKESRSKGAWDTWGVQDAERRADWLFFAFDQRRIYAPLEHRELPHLFAGTTRSAPALLAFVLAYGRLGWHELSSARRVPPNPWLQQALRTNAAAISAEGGCAVYSEPVEWINAHAQTVGWCLQAAHALAIERRSAKIAACRQLAQSLPKPAGLGATIGTGLLREQTIGNVSPVDFVGGMLEDYLWINLQGVRRRVHYSDSKLRSLWGGECLLESIYTMVADGATGGRLAQCQAKDCGAVFLQTDERQRFCPPREGQEKSTCMNRERVRRYRKGKEHGRGKTSRTR